MFYKVTDTMTRMEIKKLLAANIQAVMKVRGFKNGAELARASGVSAAMVGNILREERDTTTGTLVKLAKALRVQPWTLLVNADSIDAATAPGAAPLLQNYASLDESGRSIVQSVAAAQAATQPKG